MMEEMDFEYEVLSIHPDEEIRKIEAIENDTNSNLDEASDSYTREIEVIEADTNSNLDEASDSYTREIEVIEADTNSNLDEASDSYTREIEVIEADTNSNLDEASDSYTGEIEVIEGDTNSNLEEVSDAHFSKIEGIETDANSNLEEASDSYIRNTESIEKDTNSNLEEASDSYIKKNEAVGMDANPIVVQTLDSDSGEIDDDEEANDLEEGEIQDSSPVTKKKSDIPCRFFKRGSCAFGSQCQYLHVSDSVYNMFDTKPQKRNDMPPLEHNFPKPLIFPPIVLPPRPFIEPRVLAVPQIDFQRQNDTFEDNWEKGLEQARILIRKANLKKKSEEYESKKSNSKDEKIKGQNFTKADLGNELDFSNKKYYEKNSNNSSFRKENTYDERKSNYRHQPKSNDRWVDPWRRSKSPVARKRPRSLSGSLPPNSRKRSSTSSSISSVSSSSSEIEGIYRRPYEKKSPRGQQGYKSRSRSVSQSRRSKKRKMSPKHSSNGRRNFRSNSRSLSVSPYRKRSFSSRSRSRSSSSSSSCSNCHESSNVQGPKMRKVSANLSEQISQKSPKRTSELFDSDCETSEMTVSSASCTSLSSDSEPESPHHSSYFKYKRSPNRNNASSYSNQTTISNTKTLKKNQSNLLKNRDLMQHKNDTVPAYQRKVQTSDNRKSANNWSLKTEPSDYKSKNISSYFSSIKKPASSSKDPENQMCDDMELLSAYQRKTEPIDYKTKNTATYFSSVKKPSSASKVSENQMCSDMELLSAYQRKTEPSDCKPKSTASSFNSVKKPATAHKASENKLSSDMELLFMYQGLGSSNTDVQKAKSNNPTSKPNRTKDAVNVTNKANGNSYSHDDVSKDGNTPKKNIVLNLQPKCKEHFKPGLFNEPRDLEAVVTKKETASKREQLLNKLKLIDDAIARKKSK